MKPQRILVLPENTDTDQIITAEYMKFDPTTEEGRASLGQRAFCGLPAGFPEVIDRATKQSHFQVILAGPNFGCGSSREHAPVAMGMAGIKVVIAPSFARIFYRNCIVSGEVLPLVAPELDIAAFQTGQTITIDREQFSAKVRGCDQPIVVEPFGSLANIVEAGGLFQFARQSGRIWTL